MVCNGTGGRRHLIHSPDDPIAMRNALRSEMRLRRRALPPFRRRLANRALTRHLLGLPAYRRAQALAVYWPADGEVDVRAIAAHAWSGGKRLYLPVVGHAGTMRFVPWTRCGQLRKNRFGIPEPVGARQRIRVSQLDLVVMPLVAFDGRGNRLGMGGGYYDRVLGVRRRRPLLVGAAFSFQQAPIIPAQPWDVPLDEVITERGRRPLRRSPSHSAGGADL
jgi:5-formyltetrahydrofolate cyclo-ligase